MRRLDPVIALVVVVSFCLVAWGLRLAPPVPEASPTLLPTLTFGQEAFTCVQPLRDPPRLPALCWRDRTGCAPAASQWGGGATASARAALREGAAAASVAAWRQRCSRGSRGGAWGGRRRGRLRVRREQHQRIAYSYTMAASIISRHSAAHLLHERYK